jgi:hypothetical protein
MNVTLHLARKDIRQHGLVLATWVGLVVLRGLLVGSGLEAHLDEQRFLGTGVESPLRIAYWCVSLMQTALLVAIAVQVVQSDSFVGTTAFWLTRPIPRWRLAAAKLLTPAVFLVGLAMLVEAIVLAANGVAWPDVGRAVGETALERAIVLLSVMAVAAVTANLASWLIALIAVATGALFLQFLFRAMLELDVGRRSAAAANTGAWVATAVGVAAGLAVLLHQIRTRRTPRSVCLLAAGVVLFLLIGNRWTADWSRPETLEAAQFDPAQVKVTLGPGPVAAEVRPDGHRFYTVRATLATLPPRPGIVLVPLAVMDVGCGSNRVPITGGGTMFRNAYDVIQGPPYVRKDVLRPLLGGVEVQNGIDVVRHEANPFPVATLDTPDYERAMRDGLRCGGQVSLGAVRYSLGAELPLRVGATASSDGHGLTVMSAACGDYWCDVVVRDVAVELSFFGQSRSHVEYALVDRGPRAALVGVQRTAFAFGHASLPLLTEHLGITHRLLRFAPAAGAGALAGSQWLRDGALVAVHVRDVGWFSRRFAIDDVRTLVAR